MNRLPAPRSLALFALAAAIALLVPPVAPAQGGAPGAGASAVTGANRDIAFGYLQRARLAYREGRWAQAAEFLDVSLEFYPESSESALLYARLLLRDQPGSYRAEPYLRRALAADTWVDTPAVEAAGELAGFLVSTRRYAEARRLLESLDEAAAPASLGGRTTPRLAWIWARALEGQGQRAAAEVYLRRALQRFPQAADLHLVLSGLLAARAGEAGEALQVASRTIPDDPRIVLAQLALERTAAGRIDLADRYLAMGGGDPGAALQALRARPENPLTYFDEFLRLGGERHVLYVDSLQELLRQRLQAGASGGEPYAVMDRRLAESLRRYSGARLLDADADGRYEELYEYLDGELRGWALDADQDGLAEVQADFSAGLPVRIRLQAGPGSGAPGKAVELRYSAYPALAEVGFVDGSSRRVYSLFPYRVSAAAFGVASSIASGTALGAPAPPRPLRVRYRGGLPDDETRVRGLSYAMSEYSAPGSATGFAAGSAASGHTEWPQRRYHLLEGAVTRVEQAPDGRGNYRHVVQYDRSGPTEGRRDEDGDGRYEIREEYAGGRLVRLLLDEDGDGVAEFAQELGGGSAGPRLLWDYDEDGRYDSVQYETAAGDTVREFSSRLDGVYDLRAVFRAGRIVAFLRDGRSVPVTYEQSRNVYWLGRRLPGDVPLSGLSEGRQVIRGRRVFVLRHMGNLYVGELE